MPGIDVHRILNELQQGRTAGKKEIQYLLGLSDPEKIRLLFNAAQQVRNRHFGTRIFLYGFLYFSTYCRNNCNFCQYRQANKGLARYRKSMDQILFAAREMADAGVHLIDLTMGEDPELYAAGEGGFNHLLKLVTAVGAETGLPMMISPGSLPDNILEELAQEKVSWYACYQETHNRELYATLRQGQGFEERLAKKYLARRLGMLVEEGILTGVGESLEDLADSIAWMRDFHVDQARVMTFVPQDGTPMANILPQDNIMEQKIIAVMRLLMPDTLIPASLDVDGLSGLKARLLAGANVVTSIVPPQNGLAGVAHSALDIEDARRTLACVLPVLETCGLEPAGADEYRAWIGARQAAAVGTPVLKSMIPC